jgi:hypothetical protein
VDYTVVPEPTFALALPLLVLGWHRRLARQ